MHVHLDHLAAALVGAVVLLALAVLGVAAQSDGVEAASSDALRTQVESFGDVVQADLESLSRPVSLDATAGAFAFWARTEPHDTTQHLVRYDWVAAGERAGVPVFRVERSIDGAAAGGSGDLFRAWAVVALAADGSPAAAPAEVAEVYASFDAVAPFLAPSETRAAQRATRWETRVPPILLHSGPF